MGNRISLLRLLPLACIRNDISNADVSLVDVKGYAVVVEEALIQRQRLSIGLLVRLVVIAITTRLALFSMAQPPRPGEARGKE